MWEHSPRCWTMLSGWSGLREGGAHAQPTWFPAFTQNGPLGTPRKPSASHNSVGETLLSLPVTSTCRGYFVLFFAFPVLSLRSCFPFQFRYNILTQEEAQHVYDARYYGGQCETVYNGEWRELQYDPACERLYYGDDDKYFRKPYNFLKYHFEVSLNGVLTGHCGREAWRGSLLVKIRWLALEDFTSYRACLWLKLPMHLLRAEESRSGQGSLCKWDCTVNGTTSARSRFWS